VPRVNEDQASKELSMTQKESVESTVEDDRELLEHVATCFPPLADLSRGDVFLFKPGDNPDNATVIGLAPGCAVPYLSANFQSDAPVGRRREGARGGWSLAFGQARRRDGRDL
jgi:hypothetical protein